MGSMIICEKETRSRHSDKGGRGREASRGGAGLRPRAPAHLSVIFEIFVCPAQLLYQNWI